MLNARLLLLSCLVVATTAYYPSELTETSPLNPPENLRPTRVPQCYQPTQYWVTIRPYFPSSVKYESERNFTFDGSNKIELKITKSTSNITVNLRELVTIDEKTVTVECDDNQMTVIEVKHMPKGKDQIAVMLDKTLRPGMSCNLTFGHFEGPINDFHIASIFKTSYFNGLTGERRWIVASHFEEGGMLRSAIPAFDEPMYKALWHMTVEHPTDLKALSNGVEIETMQLQDGWAATRFAAVKKMPPYMVAFAIGDFVGIERKTKTGTLVRAWAWHGMEPYLDVALDTGVKVLEWFGDYLDVPFPLEKQDLLALPDFRPGAMENWGLVIFRHQAMCFNPHMDTSLNKATSVINTIAHELAHQWFGDLVTMKWWNDLWLNEGNAAFWSSKAAYGIHPEQATIFDITSSAANLETALKFDGVRRKSHSLTDPRGPFFDAITYQKGASILRMINHTMSEPLFQKAMRNYLKSHQYGNVVHQDLLDAFTSVAESDGIQDWCGKSMNFTKFLAPWIHQQGFPTIVVQKGDDGAKQIYQKPYQDADELDLPVSPYNYEWNIPNWYRTVEADGHYHLSWLLPKDVENECDMPSSLSRNDATVTVENAASRAVARVLYDNATWQPIMEFVRNNPDAFDPLTRTQLLNDALVYMETDDVPGYARFLNLSLFLANEHSLAPWKYAAIPEYEQFALDFMQGEYWPLLLHYFSETIGPVYDKLGWHGGADWDENALRGEITKLACRFHLSDCMSKAQALFKTQFLPEEGGQGGCAEATVPYCSKVDPDLRIAVYSAGIELGSEADFNRTFEIFLKEKRRNKEMTTERNNILNGLTCTRHQASIIKLIELGLKDDERTGGVIFTGLGRNPVATKVLWDYLKKNTQKVLSSPVNHDYLHQMTASWNTECDIDKINNLMSNVKSSLKKNQMGVLKNATLNVKHHKEKFTELGHSIQQWLKERYDVSKPSALSTRIPTDDVQPLSYNITIRPYFPTNTKVNYDSKRDFTFDGELILRVRCHKATNEIYLNQDKLNVTATTVRNEIDGSIVPLALTGTKLYETSQQMVIMLAEGLKNGATYQVHLQYTGLVNTYEQTGLFRSAWINSAGQKEHLIATQFEHIRARSVFPSFDEPMYKTPYLINLEYAKGLTAISNTPEHNTTYIGNGWVRTQFDATPQMSSYLVAFAIGNLTSIETVDIDGTQIRVFERSGSEETLHLALSVANKTLQWFNEYLREPYPLSKLDVIGLPQFLGGGMENWGLITMKSDLTKFDEKLHTTFYKADLVKVLVHEIAHQWFGDLATFGWWEDLFLSEGFACFFEYDTPNYIFPNQKQLFSSRYVPEILSVAQKGDASNNSHAIHNHKDHDPDFGSAITYDKGAALLRMLRFVLGRDAFQLGLQKYMSKYAFRNAKHEELFDQMTLAADKFNIKDWCGEKLNVTVFMNYWMLQRGFPVVFVESEPSVTYFSQKPYTDRSSLPESKYKYEWPIPIWYNNTDGEMTMDWLVPEALGSKCGKSSSITLPARSLQLTEARVYAVTDWDHSSWAQTLNTFFTKPMSLDVNVRAQTLSDLQLLSQRDPSYNQRLLRISQYLASETNLAPWDTIRPQFAQWSKVAEMLGKRAQFTHFMLQIHVPVYQQLGWNIDSDDWDRNILRSKILKETCQLGHFDCIKEATKRAEIFFKSCADTKECSSWPEPDLQEAIFCGAVVRDKNSRFWNQLFDLFTANLNVKPMSIIAKRLLKGLVCTNKQKHFERLIDLAMSVGKDDLDFNDKAAILSELGKHIKTKEALSKYWEQNCHQMPEHPLLQPYLENLSENWSKEEKLEELDEMQDDSRFKSSGNFIAKLAEKRRQDLLNLGTIRRPMDDYFSEQQYQYPSRPLF